MAWPPSPRERDLARHDGEAELLAAYREELMKPFDELRRDYAALGDERVATDLDHLIQTARGVP